MARLREVHRSRLGWVGDPGLKRWGERIRLPRRGEALREAFILRVIAIDRMIHVVLFGIAGGGKTVTQQRVDPTVLLAPPG